MLFIVFSVLSMYDFWKWEYDYGHNLDDNAAIKVPGMAYQPPLIGFKQLLNFGAYSIPDTGGWIFIGAGFILVFVSVFEWRKGRRRIPFTPNALLLFLIFLLSGCSDVPEPIRISRDECIYCRMKIEDPRFACEMVSDKNKIMKFDDVFCVIQYVKEGKIKRENIRNIFLCDYSNNHQFIRSDSTYLLMSEGLQSPMNGNIAAFRSTEDLGKVHNDLGGLVVTWERIFK
jgi:copper chaperone NosL